MKAPREIILAVSLMLLLVLLTVAASLFQSRQELVPPLSSTSNAPDGARALRLWLEQMGHLVSTETGETFIIPSQVQIVMILEPLAWYQINAEEWESIETWVSAGGVLFLASQNITPAIGNSTLDLPFQQALVKPGAYAPPAPIFRFPPIHNPVKMNGWSVLPAGSGYLSLLSSDEGSAAVEVLSGEGRMILIAGTDFLTNTGLKDPDSAALALNLLSTLPAGGAIWMDEWHHGQRTAGSSAAGPEAWLQDTPSGRAILFTAAVIFLALLLAGRRFGRPVPLLSDQARRAPIEHVTALANLNRRAGHRRALMQYYHASLKRAFGRRYRLDSGLPDDIYIARLASYNPNLDTAALLDLLTRLSSKKITDAQMVQLARETAQWMKQLEY